MGLRRGDWTELLMSEENPKRTCATCFNYRDGYCHKYPPQLYPVTDEYGRTFSNSQWPEVGPTEWCGQWELNQHPGWHLK